MRQKLFLVLVWATAFALVDALMILAGVQPVNPEANTYSQVRQLMGEVMVVPALWAIAAAFIAAVGMAMEDIIFNFEKEWIFPMFVGFSSGIGGYMTSCFWYSSANLITFFVGIIAWFAILAITLIITVLIFDFLYDLYLAVKDYVEQ